MRRFLPVLITALAVPFAAHAQSTKQVEIINDPLAVEVTNLPAVQDVNVLNGAPGSCEVKTFQLVGFTPTLYSGNLGGVLGASRKCHESFPGARMCNLEEIQQTEILLPVESFPELAWYGPFTASCRGDTLIGGIEFTRQWSCDDVETPCRFPPDKGQTMEPSGTIPNLLTPCSDAKPIACCAPVP